MKRILMFLVSFIVFGCSMNSQQASADFPKLSGPYFGQKPPGMTPEKFTPEVFDLKSGYHSAVSFSTDGSEAVWSLNQAKKCVMYTKMTDGAWSMPKEIDFGLTDGISDPVFSPDGKRLFFISTEPLPDSGSESRERIWFVSRSLEGWSDPQPINDVVTAHPTHWTFSFAGNRNLYFTSEMIGAKGEQDIWMSVFDGEKYLSPVNLGDNINSDYRDMTPCIAPDESYLIFSRSKNMADLFISFKNPDGIWSTAERMGSKMNTRHHDICPVLSPDGKYLFFVRKFKMYWVDAKIIEKLKPKGFK